MQIEGLTTKATIRKWLVKNSPDHMDYSVEAYFRVNKLPVLQIDPYMKQTIVIDFEKFLDFYRKQTNKSAPNLSFCLCVLFAKHGIECPSDGLSVPVLSFERNNELWLKWKILQHSK
jgi:hypothetical protein